MKLLKAIKYELIALLALLIITLMELNSVFSVGKMISALYPCTDRVGDSAPCYVVWDASFIFVIFIITIAIIAYAIYKIARFNSK